MSPAPKQPVLDDISKRIVELLQVDGRRPYAEIAREVGRPIATHAEARALYNIR